MVPALAALLTAVSAGAQNAQLDGLLVTASQFTPVDMMKYSQNNYSFTTGRVAAMGGAFTALGGDMASMGINPAGLGMYRNSVWGLSPAMTFTGNRNAYATAHDNNASRFSFNNIGTVLQLSQRSNGLVSFNLGLSYNKMEDFNYRGSVRLPAAAPAQRSLRLLQHGYVERSFGERPQQRPIQQRQHLHRRMGSCTGLSVGPIPRFGRRQHVRSERPARKQQHHSLAAL